MEARYKSQAFWCWFGTFLIMAYYAYAYGGFTEVLSEFGRFLTLDTDSLTNGSPLLMQFPVLAAVICLSLPASALGGVFQNAVLGNFEGHALKKNLSDEKPRNHFRAMFLMVTLEELFARWLFLGVLAPVLGLTSGFGFLVLVLVGNTLWSLMHLSNFVRKQDKHALRTLPQFISGVFYTYVFVKYGLFATILTHYAENALIFTWFKKYDSLKKNNLLVLAYCAFVTLLIGFSMKTDLSDMLIWFENTSQFAIPGWEFRDYFLNYVFVCFLLYTGMFFLLYDEKIDLREDLEKIGKGGIPIVVILWLLIAIGCVLMYYLFYWIAGWFTDYLPLRVLIAAMMVPSLASSPSPNHASRLLFVSVPTAFVLLCTIEALGFWSGVGLFSLAMFPTLPMVIIGAVAQD